MENIDFKATGERFIGEKVWVKKSLKYVRVLDIGPNMVAGHADLPIGTIVIVNPVTPTIKLSDSLYAIHAHDVIAIYTGNK